MTFAPETNRPAVDDLPTAMQAVKAGEITRAHAMLTRLVDADRGNAAAWLWLSSTVENLDQVGTCLEQVLELEPGREDIRQRLLWIAHQTETARPEMADLSDDSLEELVIREPGNHLARQEWLKRTGQPAAESAPIPADRRFLCPQCGGRMRFNPEILELQCGYCGHIDELNKTHAPLADAPLDLAGPMDKFRAVDASTRTFRCTRCGAAVVMPAGAVSFTCPYCECPTFAPAQVDSNLAWPTGIIPMQLDASTAAGRARDWLRRGFFFARGPQVVDPARLSPLYVPVWLVNAAVSIPDAGGPSLLSRRDTFYTDWVEPGMHRPALQHLAELKPFNWNELLEFDPSYLADWPASLYDVPLAEAARTACARMRADALAKFPAGAVRDVSFFCQSYNLVFFPVWIGHYTQGGNPLHFLVNGQTGAVAGDRPFDWLRVGLAAASSLGLMAFLFILVQKILAAAMSEAGTALSALPFSPAIWVLLVPVLLMLLILVFLILKL
jgi:hypothetical protein